MRPAVKPRHDLGQNFLNDESVARRIAESCGADKTCGVLEIGPGEGALTRKLALLAGKVAAIELDSRLLPVLEASLGHLANVEIVPGDALTVDLAAFTAEHLAGLEPLVCANLPYQITTPICERLLASRLFSRVCVMVQREAALRLTASVGDPQWNESSLCCSYFAEGEILFDVDRSCFSPMPHVTSSVVRFTRRPMPEGVEDTLARKLMRAAFSERRKKFSSCLAKTIGGEKEVWEERFRALGFPADVRGERFSAEDIVRLARTLARDAERPEAEQQ